MTEPWPSADGITSHLGVTKDTVYTWVAEKCTARLEIVGDYCSALACDADPDEFRLAAQALRMKHAALYDPMAAINSTDVDPLPH